MEKLELVDPNPLKQLLRDGQDHISEWRHATGCQTPSEAKRYIELLKGERNLRQHFIEMLQTHLVNIRHAVAAYAGDSQCSESDNGPHYLCGCSWCRMMILVRKSTRSEEWE